MHISHTHTHTRVHQLSDASTTNAAAGTPAYMAPELLRGERECHKRPSKCQKRPSKCQKRPSKCQKSAYMAPELLRGEREREKET